MATLATPRFSFERPFGRGSDSVRRVRAAWISDVRTTLEKYGIGWTMWDYSGGFAVVTKQNGVPVPDEITVKALGMTMPPTRRAK